MKQPLSPAAVQALIWLGAAALVIVVAVVAFRVNRPAPTPPPEAAQPSVSMPPTQPTQPTTPAPMPTGPVATGPAAPAGAAPMPTQSAVTPPLPPAGTIPGAPPGSTVTLPMRREPGLAATAPGGLPPANPPAPGSTKVTEAVYLEIAAKMLLIAEGAARNPNAQKATEEAYKDLLINRGVSEADFRKYSNAVAADPQRRDRIKQLVLTRADRLRVLSPTARTRPGLGTAPRQRR